MLEVAVAVSIGLAIRENSRTDDAVMKALIIDPMWPDSGDRVGSPQVELDALERPFLIAE